MAGPPDPWRRRQLTHLFASVSEGLRPAGLEPATPGLGNRCSILLSYGRGKLSFYRIVPERGMLRTPFVWEVRVRREVLEDEIARLRELPDSLRHDVVGRQVFRNARGRDERTYRIRVTPVWAQPGSDDIRVIVALERPSLHRRLMRQSFVITPDNRFLE